MAIASYLLKAYGLKTSFFERATGNPCESQKRVLFEILSRNKNTAYGKEHNFTDCRSVEDYQRNVPLNDYESLRPYIERMIGGKNDILTRDRVILFGVTSGTTGKPKHIPVTEFSRRKKREVMDIWTYFTLRDHPDVLRGKVLTIVSPEIEGYTTRGIPFGAESGHAYKNMPEAVKNIYALPYEVFEIKDYDAKYYCILRLAVEQNVTVIAALNPSTILLLCQRLERIKDRIIEDIQEGSLDNELSIRYDIRKKIEKILHPNPKRADELRRLMEKREGRLVPRDCWPDLRLIVCWKGGTVGVYMSHFKEYFNETIKIRDFGYLSSEARASVPVSDEGCAGALAITSNFYEFIPLDDIDKGRKDILLAHQLKEGEEYYVVLTTYGGLYRYNIDDIIKVIGFYNATPLIEFKQKGSVVSSVTGEKVYESHIKDAVRGAADMIGIGLQFFSAFVEWEPQPRYAFLVELMAETSQDAKLEFLRNIESQLLKINVEYETKRRSQRLAHPVLKVVPKGTFENHRSKMVGEGRHDGQFKMPILTSDINFHEKFNIIEEIKI
ncbi:MAG: GH3 auxin-responsive promoter family protein [Candidatus Omnitrophica bacterium]|nr:GH3 auxin-responsive promoter family protein [Candidatus Omnitrophota bacterium]